MQVRRSRAVASRTFQPRRRLSLRRLPASNGRAVRRRCVLSGGGRRDLGTSKEYVRTAASGGKVRSYFCPECGSTVYWKADNLPAMIGVAVGAISVPNYPAPIRSVFEQSKHAWVEISGAEHFQQSSAPKHSK